jgi:hypothetical protein
MMGFHTLCGLDVGQDQNGVTINVDEVTCRSCRRSRAWEAFLQQEQD